MTDSFTKTIDGIDLDFHRFYNYKGQVQYIVSYKSGTKEELLLLIAKDETHRWCYLFIEYIPVKLHHLEKGIGEAIEGNEGG